jgi:hypothetical protein
MPADAKIILIGLDKPVAILPEQLGDAPLNLAADDVPVVVWRDPKTGVVRAFDRHVEQDLVPRFSRNDDAKSAARAPFIDADTGCGWSAAGAAVTGDAKFRGQRLKAFAVEAELYWGAIHRWYPNLAAPAAGGELAGSHGAISAAAGSGSG